MGGDDNNRRFYLTTPIYYVNALPHLGTAYTTVIADIIARYKRMQGFDALLVTGSDENSQKIVLAAEETGKDPLKFCDEMVQHYHEAWRMLDIGPYEYVRTTEERHRKLVQFFFQRVRDAGYIYKGEYSGYYCTPCETFYTEKELLDEGLCPKCERPTHEVSEEAYFFKLSAFQEYLEKLLRPESEFVVPDFRLNEMRARVDEGLADVCISRSSLEWGIPLPWDDTHVFYVWVDALLAYVTGSGFDFEHPEKSHYWPAQLNLMAKDIPWFHAIIFPALLHAYSETCKDARLKLDHVEQMLVHGYWLYGESKMSKSRGGAISPREVVELVRSDGLRYFFAREVPLGLDGTISLEAIVNRYNYDLGNDLGNLLNRLLTMTEKYFGGVVPETPEYRESDNELRELTAKQRDEALALMERYELSRALEETFTIIRECNRFIDQRKPWVLGKNPERAEEFTGAFCVLFDAVKAAAILLAPVMPAAMQELWEQLGLEGRVEDVTFAEAAKPYPRGNRIGRAHPLFPRIELNEQTPDPAAPEESGEPKAVEENDMAENMIEFADFQKMEIIVAKILSAEPVAGADKLIKMQMDDGRGGRQTVAGIAPWIKPEDLVGLYVPIVANLKPAKLRGELSEGMLLAAQDDAGNLSLVVMQEEIAPGSKVV